MDGKEGFCWPGWDIGERIGKGGFGAVYEIRREVFGDIERCALKIITIPKDSGEIEYMRCEGMDDETITSTLHGQVRNIVREYKLMSQMRENPNIVHCDDFRYTRHEDDLGWDIYIKMELLTPLMKALDRVQEETEIQRLGIDICNALVACQEMHIIHRDIKPQNIFISPHGHYKLGDFGIARTMEHTTKATTGIGTYSFMAPEVALGRNYNQTVDIYSLGLVLYWLLNERRGPFVPLPPTIPTIAVNEEARTRRYSGDPVPPPKRGDDELKAIVLKACAYDPDERYQTAAEMMEALKGLTEEERTLRNPSDSALKERPTLDSQQDEQTMLDGSGYSEVQPEHTWKYQRSTEKKNSHNLNSRQEEKTVLSDSVSQNRPKKKEYEEPPKKPKLQQSRSSRVPLRKVLIRLSLLLIPCVAVILLAVGKYRMESKQMTQEITPVTLSETILMPEPTAALGTAENPYAEAQNTWSSQEEKSLYEQAEALYSSGKLEEAKAAFEALGITERVKAISYEQADDLQSSGAMTDAAMAFGALGDYRDAIMRSQNLWDGIAQRNTISAGLAHTVGLMEDGTVVAVGSNDYGQCNVENWQGIIAVAAGRYCTIGLKKDGTVVAAGLGWDGDGHYDVDNWENIVAVSVNTNRIGLVSDGTLRHGTYYKADWQELIAVAEGENHTVGLMKNGTVVALGTNSYGQCDVEDWHDIIAVAAGDYCTIGLRKDGTVVAAGNNENGECNVDNWRDIVAVDAGFRHTVGLKKDGTVVATGLNYHGSCNVKSWRDVVSISAGGYHTVGLKKDGTVVAVGYDGEGRCRVSNWKSIKVPNRNIPLIQETSIPETAPNVEESWRNNVLMLDKEFKMGASTNFVFGSDIQRNEIVSVTFLDTLKGAPDTSWDVSEEQNGSVLAWVEKSSGRTVFDWFAPHYYDLFIAGEGGVNGKLACESLFEGYSTLEKINFDGNFHTEEASSFYRMFLGCYSLTSIDFSGFATSNVTNMRGMFSQCRRLIDLDLSSFDTSHVTDMRIMFLDCMRLANLDLSGFNTSNVTSMWRMFEGCANLSSLDLSSFDTSKVLDYEKFMDAGKQVNGEPWECLFAPK